MKKLILPSMVFLLASAVAACAQSLADIAKQEKERREEIKNARVITDEDVARYRRDTQAPAAPEQQADKGESTEKAEGAESKSAAGKPEDDEPRDFEGRPESFWRKTMAEARRRVKELTNQANVLVLRIADLQNKFYSMDDGFKREELQREILKLYYEQDLNKENLDKAKAALQDLENEARKSGALPGWIASDND